MRNRTCMSIDSAGMDMHVQKSKRRNENMDIQDR